jgi:multiple sugar transport system substrate-binding protein
MRESTTSTLTRRDVLESGAAAAALAGLPGLAGAQADSVRYWNIHNSNERRQAIQQTIQSFQESGSIQVEANFIDNDEIEQQISSAIAANRLPDVALLAVQTVQRLGSDGALSTESATQVVQDLGEDDFRDATLQFMSDPEGGYFGVPSTSWVQGIWYRKSAFEEQGLDEPLTWDAILEAAETFHDPDNDQYGIGFGNRKTAYARQCFTQFARANGALVLNADKEVVFDAPEMVESLQYVQDLGQYTPGAVSFDDTRQLYENEQIHMTMWSTNILRHILNNASEEMAQDTGFGPYTENTRKTTYGQVLGHTIFDKEQPNRRAAQRLVNHMTSGDAYIAWAHSAPGGMIPARTSVTETDAYRDNEILSAWSDTISQFTDAMDNMERFDLVEGTLIPEYGNIISQNLVSEAVNRVVIQSHDPQTVANEQAQRMREVL